MPAPDPVRVFEAFPGPAVLRGLDTRLRLVIEEAKDHVVLGIDAHGRFDDWSAGAEAILGWSRDEALGQPFAMIFTPEDRALGIDAREIEDARRQGAAADRRWHLRKDGLRVFLNGAMHALPADDGAPAGFLKIARDETDRQQAEQRREAVVRIWTAFRNLADPIGLQAVAVRELGEALGASRVNYGVLSDDGARFLIGAGWHREGVPPLRRSVPLGSYALLLAELARDEIVRVVDADDDPRVRSVDPALRPRTARSLIAAPIVEHGRLVAILWVDHVRPRAWTTREAAFVREIAELTHHAVERARGDQALRDSQAVLKAINDTLEDKVAERTRALMQTEEALRQSQKMEAVGQLTGGLAHDFNNLLAAISASLQVLERRLADDRVADAGRYIAMSLDAVRRAGTLTHRLLAFSRRQTLDPQPTDIDRLVGGMADLIRRSVGPDVRLEVTTVDGLWTCRIDAPQLENALLNLCLNARDAMGGKGGRLTIATGNQALDGAAADALGLPAGDYVRLRVADTGVGMAPETIRRIFDPFFTTKPIGQGTGLGLSMVYGFVRQSGGQVEVDSALGRGAALSLYLPRHDGPAPLPVRPDAGPAASPGGGGETVVVVEDEAPIRSLIAELLTDAGYRVLTAADGDAGLALLDREDRVDLLLTDVGLPGGRNGRQVAEAARLRRPSLEVLFVTGYSEHAAFGVGRLAPGMAVLAKPFETSVLLEKVGTMIARRASGAADDA